jgi:hypothetical protein
VVVPAVSASSGTAEGERQHARRAPCGEGPAARQTARDLLRQVARARRAHCEGHGGFRVRGAREGGRGNAGGGHPERGRNAWRCHHDGRGDHDRNLNLAGRDGARHGEMAE